MRCPKCGFKNSEDEAFCLKCGVEMKKFLRDEKGYLECRSCGGLSPPSDRRCRSCGLEFAAGGVACERCGKVNRDTDKVCSSCGSQLRLAMPEPVEAAASSPASMTCPACSGPMLSGWIAVPSQSMRGAVLWFSERPGLLMLKGETLVPTKFLETTSVYAFRCMRCSIVAFRY